MTKIEYTNFGPIILRSLCDGLEAASLVSAFPSFTASPRAGGCPCFLALCHDELACVLSARLSSVIHAPLKLSPNFRCYTTHSTSAPQELHQDDPAQRGWETSTHTLVMSITAPSEGGETAFYSKHTTNGDVTLAGRCFLNRGDAILFLHRRLHRGEPVISGLKHLIRANVFTKPKLQRGGDLL